MYSFQSISQISIHSHLQRPFQLHIGSKKRSIFNGKLESTIHFHPQISFELNLWMEPHVHFSWKQMMQLIDGVRSLHKKGNSLSIRKEGCEWILTVHTPTHTKEWNVSTHFLTVDR